MISLVFLFGLISFGTCSTFLRQLTPPKTLKSLDKYCVTSIGKLIVTLDYATKEEISFELHSQAEGATELNNYAYSCEKKDEPLIQFSCTPDTTGKSPLFGKYKVENVIYTQDDGNNHTSLKSEEILEYVKDYTLGEQISSQKIEGEVTTFTVKFEAFTNQPKIYLDINSDLEIPCTADDKMETLTCTPSKENMESGKKYKIAYEKACDGDRAETGVEVEYS